MLQLRKKYTFLFILIPIFMYSINLNAKILYDKSGIIITDLDLNNYINLSTSIIFLSGILLDLKNLKMNLFLNIIIMI